MNTIYLRDIPLPEAWARLQRALQQAGLWEPLEAEEIPLDEAAGRVTAEPIWAATSSPHYHAAAMDGYALRAADTEGASDRAPVTLRLGSQVLYLDTGDPLPTWADSVVPIENVEPEGKTEGGRAAEAIRLRAAVAPWTHVRPMGEDMVVTELVLPAGRVLRPVDLGAIAGSGHARVRVRRRPRVAVLPTGSELIPVGQPPRPGQILEYNSLVLAAQVQAWGGQATRLPIVPDDLGQLQRAVARAAAAHDLVLVNAGSSAGSQDYTARVVEALGDLLVHGVAVRPGHPVILGMLRLSPARAVPVIGVPGYPVSAALTGEIFVEPLLARWLGRPPAEPLTLEAVLTRKVHSSPGDDEYLRVTVGRVGERVVAAPLSRGAGIITSLVRADGIVLIPAGVQGHEAGERVTVRLYCAPTEIDRTLVALGSHDLTLDLLAQHLAERGRRLTSANVGSQGGLVALRRGEAHFAGCHLLDPQTGEYNVPYLARYLPGVPVVLVTLVGRQQGLVVPSGNPKGIRTLSDLARPDVTFVNRQRGAGTRVLLDYHLAQLGIGPESIRGYPTEEYTHLAVAAAVASGRADCGLGIRAAAAALGLDFIPLFEERYDLAIPRQHYTSPLLQPLLEVLNDPRFRQAVAALPGYDVSRTGTVAAEIT
ncbi:MAG: molybdopterin biosynthesis protein [Chloroflexota bacterium]